MVDDNAKRGETIKNTEGVCKCRGEWNEVDRQYGYTPENECGRKEEFEINRTQEEHKESNPKRKEGKDQRDTAFGKR